MANDILTAEVRLLVDVSEAARLTSLSERTIKRLASDRAIPFVRVGRRLLFPFTKLQCWIEAGCPRRCR